MIVYKKMNELSPQAINKYNEVMSKTKVFETRKYILIYRKLKIGSKIELQFFDTKGQAKDHITMLRTYSGSEEIR